MGFVPPKKIPFGGLILTYFCHILLLRLTKSQHQLSHKTTMAVWRLVMVCLLMLFIFAP